MCVPPCHSLLELIEGELLLTVVTVSQGDNSQKGPR